MYKKGDKIKSTKIQKKGQKGKRKTQQILNRQKKEKSDGY